jgi:hypothetical protein
MSSGGMASALLVDSQPRLSRPKTNESPELRRLKLGELFARNIRQDPASPSVELQFHH